MTFLHPYLLWGLFAMAIPVIIHLFNFRRHKRVYFTNVKYIQELKQQTQRQSRLRHLMVLLARMLAIASLVIAFAQPVIPLEGTSTKPRAENAVSIYVDNSFSMEGEATEGELLVLAKRKAAEIARAYRSSDVFQLLTNDFEGSHQRLVSQEEFLDMLDEVQLSPSVQTLSNVVLRQKEVLGALRNSNKVRFLISDFQKSTADFDHLEGDSLVNTFLVPVTPQSTGNLFIDSCWFATPVHQLGQAVTMVVRVRNDSGNDYEKLPVKLTVNNVQKALSSFDIQAGSSALVELPYTNHEPGIQYGRLEITDYPVTFDDDLFLAYEVQQAIPVLNIYGEQQPVYMNALLGKDSSFVYKPVYYKNINYDELSDNFLIILDGLPEVSSGLAQALQDFTTNGGSLLIIPPTEMDLESYRGFMNGLGISSYAPPVKASAGVSYLDMEHALFKDVFEEGRLSGKNPDAPVDLPVVEEYYPLESPSNIYKISLMRLMNQADFLAEEKSGPGNVYILAVPLDDRFGNFQRHALFVPVIYRIAFLSGATSPLYYTIGNDENITLENVRTEGDNVLKVESLDGGFELIPGQQMLGSAVNLLLYGQLKLAGPYVVKSGDKTIQGLAFNYDRRESSLSCYSPDDLEDIIKGNNPGNFYLLNDDTKPLNEGIEVLNQGKRLWKLFTILALFFLASEIFLLRVWSRS